MFGGVPMSEAKKTATILVAGGLLVFGILEGGEYVTSNGAAVDAGVIRKCARKLPDSGCLRRFPLPGSSITGLHEPGDLNQFKASEAFGDCEFVDCEIEVR